MSPRLPRTRPGTKPAASEERAALEAWLRAWRADPPPTDAPAGRPPPRPQRGRRQPVRIGEIRLLRPDTPAACERPCYVAVIESDPDDPSVIAAPFGRFPVPATPGEWRTALAPTPLLVLCCWNARRMPRVALERAWPVGRLRAADRRAALRLVRVRDDGLDLPADLAPRAGPSLRHPCDPRHAYIEEERALFDGLGVPVRAAAAPADALEYPIPRDAALPIAAEPRATYRTDAHEKRRGRPGNRHL